MNLTIFEGGVLAQATVTAVGSYPLFNLSVTFTSGSETDVQRNGEIVVEDSLGNFKGRLRVRIAGTISSTNIPINEVSKGTIDLQVNDVLKFTTEHRLRPILPVADETFSPDNLTYSDQNSLLAPLAVVNEPIAVNVDPGETYATISFDASNSVALDPDSAGTLSYLWTFPDATTSTSATVNKQISAGEDIVVCEVTDTSNSKTTTRYIPVYVHDNSDRPYGVANPSITGSIEEGWRAEFTTNYDLSTVPDGALCVFWNSTETVFIGWMSEDTHSRSSSQTVTIITVLGPIAKLKEMKGYSKVMIDDDTPASWSEIKDLTTDIAMVQVLRWYTTALDILNLDLSGDSYSYPRFYVQTSTPYQQIAELADGVDSRFVADRLGNLSVHKKPELVLLSDRAAVSNTKTLDDSNMAEAEIRREHNPKISLLEARGFDSSINPIFSRWPGLAPGEGASDETVERLIASSQTNLNQRAGMRGAFKDRVFIDSSGTKRLAPTVRVRSYRTDFDFDNEYVTIDLNNPDRGVDLNDFDFYLSEMSITYETTAERTDLTFMAATAAPEGATYIPPTTNDNQLGSWDTNFSPAYFPESFYTPTLFGSGHDNILAIDNGGFVWKTTNFSNPSGSGGPNWTSSAISGLSGTPLAFTYDPTSGGNACWLLTTTAIQYISSLQTSPSASTQHTWSETMSRGGIDAAYLDDAGDFVFCAVGPAIGSNDVQYAYTTNGGSTWTTGTETRSANVRPHPSIDPKNAGVAYYIFERGFSNSLHKATNYGATITEIATIDGNNGGGDNMYIPYDQPSTRYIFYNYLVSSGNGFLARGDLVNEDYITFDIRNNTASGARPGPTSSHEGLFRNMIASPSVNGNKLYVVTRDSSTAGLPAAGFFYSDDALSASRPTFTEVFYEDQDDGNWKSFISGCHAVDDNENEAYLFGEGVAGYYTGGTVDERTGDMVTSDKILGLIGF